jgi:hypothetical protein
MTSEAATSGASGTPAQTCARCGHRVGGCPRCGRADDLLGGQIGGRDFCHVNSPTSPTCYTLASWEMTGRGQAATPNEYVVSLPTPGPIDLVGKTVRWEDPNGQAWFTALVLRRHRKPGMYYGRVLDPGTFADHPWDLTIKPDAPVLLFRDMFTVIDSEPVTQDEECE